VERVLVIGGGLAGSEAAWQAAQHGVKVTLFEMRPQTMTPAHRTGDLAELVCSNSLGSNLVDRASGLLKEELRRLGSLIVACADQTALPAGGALAVDRKAFSRAVSERISSHPWIEIRRQEAQEIPSPRPVVIATGPLTSQALSASIAKLTGEEYLYFYDAMAPIVTFDSIDPSKVFRASRYTKDDRDYINSPLSREEYYHFVEELKAAKTIPLREFERDARFFEGCLPLEVLAQRGRDALAYGPLRPTGLVDPRTGRRPYAVVQLRQDDLAGTLYNMVGFQTNLRWGEQKRVFRLLLGLEKAEFVRYGQMHRNTFINSPVLLEPTMMLTHHPGIFFAGQITGSEGYVAAAAGGLLAGLNATHLIQGKPLLVFPPTTMLGALSHYISQTPKGDFQPMKPNFGLLAPLKVRGKRARYTAYAQRALKEVDYFRIAVTTHKQKSQTTTIPSQLYESPGRE